MDERAIRLVLILEARHQRREFLQRVIGLCVGRAVFEFDGAVLARRHGALEQHVGQFGDRGASRHGGESALAQNRGFERELRCKPGAHLFFRARRTGLVVDDDVAAVGLALDAVGPRAQLENPLAERDRDFALDLRVNRDKPQTPRQLPVREPARDAREARPPQRARLGKLGNLGEMRSAERDELAHRIRGQRRSQNAR